MNIRKLAATDERIGEFINKEFTDYALKNGVELSFEESCFVAEDEKQNILGAITGRAYYNEVHIGDLIVSATCRKSGVGSSLVREDVDPKLRKYFMSKKIAREKS